MNRSTTSNQARKLAAAAAISSLDMPGFGKEQADPLAGPTTRKRAAEGQAALPSPVLEPLPKIGRPATATPTAMPTSNRFQPKPKIPMFNTVGHPQALPRLPGVRPPTAAAQSKASAAAAAAAAAKTEKGLRHFSAKVCAKVEEKGCTSYNEVADELVNELGSELGFDSKNIRRRVYDALNVLMAIDVIEKDKKEIRWLGLSNETTNELSGVQSELIATQRRIEEKQKTLKDLVQRKIALNGLISRNSRSQNSINAQTLSSTSLLSDSNIDGARADRLYLPFILINAPRDCRVHCEMLEDRTQYFFEFDMSFFINEDIELLRLMGLDNATQDELRAILTPEVYSYYQTKLKLSNPATEPTLVCPAPSTPSGTSSRHSGMVTSYHPMSSPLRSKRAPTQPAAGSWLRNQVTTLSSAPSSSASSSTNLRPPQSPQPIGHTGIFRKSSRNSSLNDTQPSTPKGTSKAAAAGSAKRAGTEPSTFDDLGRFGFSFSDNLAGDGSIEGGNLL